MDIPFACMHLEIMNTALAYYSCTANAFIEKIKNDVEFAFSSLMLAIIRNKRGNPTKIVQETQRCYLSELVRILGHGYDRTRLFHKCTIKTMFNKNKQQPHLPYISFHPQTFARVYRSYRWPRPFVLFAPSNEIVFFECICRIGGNKMNEMKIPLIVYNNNWWHTDSAARTQFCRTLCAGAGAGASNINDTQSHVEIKEDGKEREREPRRI